MRRSVAGTLGAVAIPFGFLTMHPLAMAACLISGIVLLAHAATGFGPKPKLILPLELLTIVVVIALIVSIVGLVAWLLPDG